MTLSKDEINILVTACESEQAVNSVINFDHKSAFTMKRFLLELKVQIDRWNQITRLYVFSSACKDYILQSLGSSSYYVEENNGIETFFIWGSIIEFSDYISVEKVLAMSYSPKDDFKHVALGKLDLPTIKRLQDLKVFW